MTTQPAITHTHTWDGSHNLPHWLHWDGAHPATPGRDDHTQAQPGWMLVRWSDGQITIASPQVAARAYGPDGMHGRLERAEAQLASVTALYEQWVQAGPPPLGVLLARWWDARLVELRGATHEPTDSQPKEQQR